MMKRLTGCAWTMVAWVGLVSGAIAAETTPVPDQHLIVRAPATVRIDGDLGEWDLAHTRIVIDPTRAGKDKAISLHSSDPGNPIRGAADVSARAALAWDDTWLYIAAVVVDDDLRGIKPDVKHNVGPPGWGCDSVMFQVFSFRQAMKTNHPYGPQPNMALRYEVQPGGRGKLLDDRRGVLDRADAYWKLPQGSRLASRETAKGYAVEAAVPWASLAFKPQAGEVLFCSFLLGDVDKDEALNQLGWHFHPPRRRPMFRLLGRRESVGLLTLATDKVAAGRPWSVRYQVDALEQDVQVKRVVLTCPKGGSVQRDVGVTVPKGQRAADVLSFSAMPDTPGPCTARLVATVGGADVDLAVESFEITPPAPPAPMVTNPPGEIHRMRPDRVAHNAQDDQKRGIVRHGFVTGKKDYERYILTRVKPYTDMRHPGQMKSKSPWIDRTIVMSYVLWKITGQKKYADWVRQGLAVAIETQKAKHDVRQLARLMPLRHFIWQHDPATKLAPPGIEDAVAAEWVHHGKNPPKWLFTESGYHNRCWHRWAKCTLIRHFTRKSGQAVNPRIQEYIAWHEPRLVKVGDTTDNSAGYNYLSFHYPVLVHMSLGTLDRLPKHPGCLGMISRFRQYASPSGAVPHFGDTSGWLTGVAEALANGEMMGRLTKDGRFRWQAHRIAEYLYNHFWPRHDQYHMPKDSVARAFCMAWLWADDTVAPREPSGKSRVTFKPRQVAISDEEKAARPGYAWGKLIDERVPDKLILTSGNRAENLWGLVEVLDKGGHSGQLPGHLATLMMRDSALLAGQGYYERSQDFNNVVWVEDLEGIAADPRPIRTEIPRFVEDGCVTHAQIRVLRYGGLPITSVRDIVFVKNGFVLVKDRLTFHATMKVRVGPCWQTRDLGPQCGPDWFNTYYDQLYHTGLGLGRGVHAVRNPAWDLMVAFGPRPGYRQTVLDRYDDNPYRVSPIHLRQVWSGIVRRGQTKTFTSVLLPHAPAFDAHWFREQTAFLVDNDRTTVVRVPETFRTRRRLNGTIWVQLHDGKGTVEAKGWASDARLVVARRNAPGKLSRPFIVDGKTIRVADTDLSAKARRGKATVVYTVKAGDGR